MPHRGLSPLVSSSMISGATWLESSGDERVRGWRRPYPAPPRELTVGRVPMDVARAVFGVSIILGPLVVLLSLLNLRDRRASRLRRIVHDQLGVPELRGRVGVHIKSAVLSPRRAVIVDLLAGTPHETSTLFARL